MNVTQEIRKNHIIYGASDYTAAHSLAASKSLNYARGASLGNPERALCTVVPHTFRYDGDVGLFGAENYFIKVDLNVVGDIVSTIKLEYSLYPNNCWRNLYKVAIFFVGKCCGGTINSGGCCSGYNTCLSNSTIWTSASVYIVLSNLVF